MAEVLELVNIALISLCVLNAFALYIYYPTTS